MLSEVNIDNRVLRAFRRRALRKYPNEYVRVLWGKIDNDVARIYCTAPVNVHYSDSNEVDFNADDDFGALVGADLIQLGTIHSHCENGEETAPAIPSVDDYEDARKERELISGICVLRKFANRLMVGFNFFTPDGIQVPLVIGEKD
jgi:proteasome lid subunit RPN8/RPN11